MHLRKKFNEAKTQYSSYQQQVSQNENQAELRQGQNQQKRKNSSTFLVKLTNERPSKTKGNGGAFMGSKYTQGHPCPPRKYSSQIQQRRLSSMNRGQLYSGQREGDYSIDNVSNQQVLPDVNQLMTKSYQHQKREEDFKRTQNQQAQRGHPYSTQASSKHFAKKIITNNTGMRQSANASDYRSPECLNAESKVPLNLLSIGNDGKMAPVRNETYQSQKFVINRKSSMDSQHIPSNQLQSRLDAQIPKYQTQINFNKNNEGSISHIRSSHELSKSRNPLSLNSQNTIAKQLEDYKLRIYQQDQQIECLQEELETVNQDNQRMKDINKDLLEQIQDFQQTSQSKSLNQHDVTKVHSLYQDLYLTDMKKDLNEVEFELKSQKEVCTEAKRDVVGLRKEIVSYQGIVKRYRKMVKDLQQQLAQNQLVMHGPPLKKKDSLQSLIQGDDYYQQVSFDNTSQYTINDKKISETDSKFQFGLGSPGRGPQKPTNVNSVDLQKMERLQTLVVNLFKMNKLFKTFITMLQGLKTCVNCSIVTLFLFNSKVSDHKMKDHVYMQKTMIDGKWVDRIGVNEKDVSEPAFKRIDEASKIIRTQEYLAFPVFNRNKELIACIQVEARRKKHNNQGVGFYLIDELIMKIATNIFQMKLDKIIAEQEITIKEEEVVNTIQLASSICTQRNYRDLLRNIRISLPTFLGFEAVGVLLRDLQNQDLFTISENMDKLQAEEELGDQFRQATIIRFPSSLGVTGQVFASGEVYVSNKASKDRKFSSDIDNLTPIGDVNSFMIGPIYGHKDNQNKKQPIGIIQFINKKNFKQINEYDQRKFLAIQDLLGLSLDNTAEVHTTINVTIAVRETFNNLTRLLNKMLSNEKQTLDAESSIDLKFDVINQMISKISESKRGLGL